MPATGTELLEERVNKKYEAGFVTDVAWRIASLIRCQLPRTGQRASCEHSPGVSSMHSVIPIGPSSAPMTSVTVIVSGSRASV